MVGLVVPVEEKGSVVTYLGNNLNIKLNLIWTKWFALDQRVRRLPCCRHLLLILLLLWGEVVVVVSLLSRVNGCDCSRQSIRVNK